MSEPVLNFELLTAVDKVKCSYEDGVWLLTLPQPQPCPLEPPAKEFKLIVPNLFGLLEFT